MHTRNLFLLEITFLVIFIVFILPLLNLGMRYAIHLWGQSYITEENALSFLTNPPTLLILLLFLLLISLFLLFQLITIIHYCNSEKVDQKPNFLHLLMISLLKTKRCLYLSNTALPFFAVLLYLFTNITLLIGITIPAKFELPVGDSDIIFVKMLLLLAYLLLGFIAFRGLFVIHFCINEHQGFLDSLELSKTLLRGRNLRTIRVLVIYNIGLTLGCFAAYYILLLLVALFVFLFAEKGMVITVFLSIYPRMNVVVSVLFHIIALLTNINIINSFYIKYREEDFSDILPTAQTHQEHSGLLKIKKHRHFINGFLIFVITVGAINFYSAVRDDSFYLRGTLSGIQISSHRGNSHVAPENTLPSLEYAIVARSDYAEIDVRQTKDGVLILLHDKSLLRTAGLSKNIRSINFKELSGLDAGSWFSKDFIKTRIPTLEAALKLCKGRIKLNIEIKADQKEKNFEEVLIALIDEYDFENQCLISSSDYTTLIKVKKLNSNLKTGLILSATYGNFYNKEYIDFFSIRSRNITSYVVNRAHIAGKEVHAWTVNSISEIDRMKSVGVDCIITDNPTLTREILYQDDTNKTFIQLLRRMINNRSLFRLIPI